MKKIVSFFLFVLVLSLPLKAQQSIEGHWEGSIDIFGNMLDFNVDFKNDPDSIRGTINIPVQKAMGLKLIHVKSKNNKVYFELPAGPGLAIFDGKLSSDSIKGNFMQGGFNGTFFMFKGERKIDTTEIKDPYLIENASYKQEAVTFTNGDITFAGTLTIPDAQGEHPAMVMITGSGPQNRDEEIMGLKPFRIIADYLTRNGIAVLRYDDRNVGGSTGKSVGESTTDEFAGDVNEAVKYLKTRADINPRQVGLWGHSEGGIIAPIVASKYNSVSFIVLMAGTGVKGIDVLKEQSKLIMKANKSTDDEINGYMLMLDKVYEASTTGNGWSDIKEGFRQSMEENYDRMTTKEKKSIPDKDAYVKSMTESTLKQFKSPWMEYFMSYDPSIALTKVTCPVLMLFGEKDLQVPPKQNEKPMTDALKEGGNKDYTVKKFPAANHLFQSAITGNPAEYATLPKEFVPEFLEYTTAWILQRVTVVK